MARLCIGKRRQAIKQGSALLAPAAPDADRLPMMGAVSIANTEGDSLGHGMLVDMSVDRVVPDLTSR